MENKEDYEVEGDQYLDEATIIEDEKEYSEKELPAGFEDLLYEEWWESKMGIDENHENE